MDHEVRTQVGATGDGTCKVMKNPERKGDLQSLKGAGDLCKRKAVPLHAMEALGGRGSIAPRWG
jgi:hypothetical protein